MNPILSIALTEVLVEMFSKMMTKPIESLGNSIYIFNKEVLSKLNNLLYFSVVSIGILNN